MDAVPIPLFHEKLSFANKIESSSFPLWYLPLLSLPVRIMALITVNIFTPVIREINSLTGSHSDARQEHLGCLP